MSKKKICLRCEKKFVYDDKADFIPDYCPECTLIIAAEEKAKDEERRRKAEEERQKGITFTDMPDRSLFPNDIYFCLACTIAAQASDLHYKTGTFPNIRKGGILYCVSDYIPTTEDVFDFIVNHVNKPGDIKETERVYDFSFEESGARFRCCGYHDINGWCISFRYILFLNGDFSSLGIPELLKDMVRKRSGLILITGPTGSGKSTTLARLIDYLNTNTRKHIITIEDPIEFVHKNKNSIISQREVKRDTVSFDQAIVEAMREDPDVIMVGEMRDEASIEAGLRAAETGHLVLATLHTRSCASTINRIIDVFTEGKQGQIRVQLSLAILGAVSQQLVPSAETPGKMHLATEVMVGNNAIRSTIRDNKIHMLDTAIQTSSKEGMHTMKSSLDELLANGKITQESYNEFLGI